MELKSEPIVIRLRRSQVTRLDELCGKWGYRNRTALLEGLAEFAISLDSVDLSINEERLRNFQEPTTPLRDKLEDALGAFEALHGALEFVVRSVLSKREERRIHDE